MKEQTRNYKIVNLINIGSISESCFLNPKESTWVLPITQKCSMPESNWGSRWWRKNWIGKKRDSNSSCKMANETIAGIEILFKEKEITLITLSVSLTGIFHIQSPLWVLTMPLVVAFFVTLMGPLM